MSDTKEQLKTALDNFLTRLAEKSAPDISKAQIVKTLTDAYSRLQIKHDFKVGDLVQWKEELRNLKPEGPFIITTLLPEPLMFGEDSGAATGETYSAYALFVNSEGDVMRLPIGLDRLEPFVPDADETIN